ncbi:MAG: iron-sulfur cluster biosynthesis family protein [Pseudomonadota bacterium]
MITITPTAAKQILLSFKSLPADDKSVLRIAVQQKPDGDFHYIMGLDEPKNSDTRFVSNEVNIALAEEQSTLMDKMEIDYVEVNPGEFNFIFKNPNDPKYKKPEA